MVVQDQGIPSKNALNSGLGIIVICPDTFQTCSLVGPWFSGRIPSFFYVRDQLGEFAPDLAEFLRSLRKAGMKAPTNQERFQKKNEHVKGDEHRYLLYIYIY